MKKIQTISTLGLILILTTLIIGCGGGDSSFSDNSTQTVVVTCDTNTTSATWTTVNNGDTVTAETGTELLWKQTSIKQVCVKPTTPTGSAMVN